MVISGHQWSSVAISGHQWSSVISGPQCLTYACSVHDPSRGSERESHACIAASEPRSASPRSTSDMPTCIIREFIRGHPRPSEAIRGHPRPSEGEAHLVEGLLRLEDPHLVRQLVAVAALAACQLERVCAQRRHGPINETLAAAYLMREAIRRHQSEEGGNQTSSE